MAQNSGVFNTGGRGNSGYFNAGNLQSGWLNFGNSISGFYNPRMLDLLETIFTLGGLNS
jgi:hypothetical protein